MKIRAGFKSDRCGIETHLGRLAMRLITSSNQTVAGLKHCPACGTEHRVHRSNQTVAGLKLIRDVFRAPGNGCSNQTVAGLKQ